MTGRFPSDWYLTTYQALYDLWSSFLIFLPKFIGALVVFVIGWFLSNWAGRLLTELLRRIKFNKIFERGGWNEAFRKAELEVDASEFLGVITKWTLVFVFLVAAVEILGMIQFAVFLTKVLSFLPSVIVSVLILVVAVILADILQKVVVASVERANVGYARLAGLLARWSILVFAFLAILLQLGIAKQLVVTLFTGLVGVFTISLGLAFGLGGKDMAKDILEDFREKIE
jgi:uncharacterized membrane protein